MPVSPIDMLVNFLQMNNAVNEIEKNKENILNTQITNEIKTNKKNSEDKVLLEENDTLEINSVDLEGDAQNHYYENEKNEQEDESEKQKKFNSKLETRKNMDGKGHIIDIRE